MKDISLHQWCLYCQTKYSKTCLKRPLKKDKTKTNGSLMKVESIAECSKGAFCNTFDLHQAIIGLEKQFLVFFLSGCLRQVLLHSNYPWHALSPHSASLVTFTYISNSSELSSETSDIVLVVFVEHARMIVTWWPCRTLNVQVNHQSCPR